MSNRRQPPPRLDIVDTDILFNAPSRRKSGRVKTPVNHLTYDKLGGTEVCGQPCIRPKENTRKKKSTLKKTSDRKNHSIGTTNKRARRPSRGRSIQSSNKENNNPEFAAAAESAAPTDRVREYRNKMSDLKAALDEERAEKKEMEDEMEDLTEENMGLKAKLKAQESEAESYRNEAKSLDACVDDRDKKISELKYQNKEKEEENIGLGDENLELEEKIDELQDKLKSESTKIESLQSEVEQLRSLQLEVEQLRPCKSEVEQLTAKNKTLTNRTNYLLAELEKHSSGTVSETNTGRNGGIARSTTDDIDTTSAEADNVMQSNDGNRERRVLIDETNNQLEYINNPHMDGENESSPGATSNEEAVDMDGGDHNDQLDSSSDDDELEDFCDSGGNEVDTAGVRGDDTEEIPATSATEATALTESRTGHEGKELIFSGLAKLHVWEESLQRKEERKIHAKQNQDLDVKREWIERGNGEAKIYRQPDTKKLWFEMREEKIKKAIASHPITRDNGLERKDDVRLSWKAFDCCNYEKESKFTPFTIRFGNKERADRFMNDFKSNDGHQAPTISSVECPPIPRRSGNVDGDDDGGRKPAATPAPQRY